MNCASLVLNSPLHYAFNAPTLKANMTGAEIVQQIVEILVSGLKSLGAGIGGGLKDIVTAMAFTTNGDSQELSIFFIMVLVFSGVALAVGLTRMIYTWLTSLGN